MQGRAIAITMIRPIKRCDKTINLIRQIIAQRNNNFMYSKKTDAYSYLILDGIYSDRNNITAVVSLIDRRNEHIMCSY